MMAYRILIRELLILAYSQSPDAVAMSDIHSKAIVKATRAALPKQLDPAISEGLVSEMGDIVEDILAEVRKALVKLRQE